MILVGPSPLRLRNGQSTGTKQRLTLDRLTEGILVRIARQTPGSPIVFPAGSRLTTRIMLRAGTDDIVIPAFCRGGEMTVLGPRRLRVPCTEAKHYRGITTGYFGGDTVLRLGEYKTSLDVLIEFLLDGDPIDTTYSIEAFSSEPLRLLKHNSATYDNSAVANDSGTFDGVVTVSLTTTGSDLKGCAAGWNIVDGTPKTTASLTWDSTAMTQIADLATDILRGAGYYYNGPSAGSSSIVHTLSSSTGVENHGAVAVSVNSAGDLASSNSASSTTGSPSVTITSPASDSIIVDMVGIVRTTAGLTPGANQTERQDQHDGGNLAWGASTQSGADGGAMTWSETPPFGGWSTFAVNFPAAAGGGGPSTPQGNHWIGRGFGPQRSTSLGGELH